MALVNCWECETEISDSASDCPKCGARQKNVDTPQTTAIQHTSIVESKNTGLAILLALLFGPLGLLYASVKGGIIMIIVSLVLGVATAGLAVFITWPITVIWAVVAANSDKKKVLDSINKVQ